MTVPDSGKLFITFSGNRDGIPILLLHGFGADSSCWKYQEPYLRDKFHLIAVDLPFHGKSHAIRESSIEAMSETVYSTISDLLREKCIVIGHSLGGIIAFRLTLDHPDLVRALITVNSFSRYKLDRPGRIAHGLLRLSVVYFLGLQAWGLILARQLFPGKTQAHLRREVIGKLSANSKERYLRTIKALVGYSLTEELHRISCPALLISADNDYTPVEEKRSDAKLMAQGYVEVIHDSRHFSIWDQPESVNRAIGEFLKNNGID